MTSLPPRGRVLLAALLLSPALPAMAEEVGVPWWDARWHFRLPVVVSPDGLDPVDGAPVDLRGLADGVVLVPLDVTAALKRLGERGEGWPFDSAGRPLGWTFDPSTVRVVEPGPDGTPLRRAGRDTLAARFFPLTWRPGDASGIDAAPYDAQANAAGVLAVVLPGPFDGPRLLHVYLDTVERGAKPPAPARPSEEARLAQLGAFGPGAAFLARVPSVPDGAALRLVAVPVPGGDGPATLGAWRLAPGAAPEPLLPGGQVRVDAGGARFALPAAAEGYDLRARASRPMLLALETAAPGRPATALFYPSLDGGAAGRAFLLPGLAGTGAQPAADVVGAGGRAEVRVVEAPTGREVAAFTVSRLAARTLDVPVGALYRLDATEDVLVLARGGAGADGSGYLLQALDPAGATSGSLLLAQRAAGHAAVGDAPATATAYPLARPSEALRGRVGDPPRDAWVAKGGAAGTSEPWALLAEGASLAALVGSEGHAPLLAQARDDGTFAVDFAAAPDRPAGDGARPLQGVLLAPLPGTEVRVEARALNGSHVAEAEARLALAGSLGAFPDGTRPLVEEGLAYRVTASRPFVLALGRPGAPATGFLPGLPAMARAEPGPLEHHGALLLWSEPLRIAEARPGETASVRLELTNLGRGADGAPLDEDVALRAEPVRDGACAAAWEPSLAAARLEAFPSPGARDVVLLVAVPPDAARGACAEVRVVAASGREPGVEADARVLVRARAGFEPVLEVLDAEGRASAAGVLAIEPGGTGAAALRLRNAGSEGGAARLAFAPGPGYDATLRLPDGTLVAGEDGRTAAPVTLAAGGEARLELRVAAPAAGAVAWDLPVEAVSAADPAARDQVTVTLLPRGDARLAASPSARRLEPEPGGNATVGIDLRSLGGDVEVRLRPTAAPPPGWSVQVSPERVLLRAAGASDAAGRLLDRATVNVTVRAPANASVGDAHLLTLLLEPSHDPRAAQRLTINAVVVNDYALDLPAPALVVPPAGEGVAPLPLASRAAGPFRVAVAAVHAPAGWDATVAGWPDRLAPGQRAEGLLRVAAPPLARAGAHRVAVELALADDVSPPRRVLLAANVTVPLAEALRFEGLPAAALLAPNASLAVGAWLVNDGNAPADVALALEAGPLAAAWAGPDRATIPPGGRLRVAATLRAPAEPGFGDAQVAFDARGGRGSSRAEVAVHEARVDLVVEAVEATLAPRGAFATVVVANRGTLAAPGVQVRLTGAGGLVAEATLAALPPAQRATHVLPLPASAGEATVRVASADGAPDGAPGDNEAVVRWTAPREQATPGPGAPATALGLGAVAAAAVLRRRRAA